MPLAVTPLYPPKDEIDASPEIAKDIPSHALKVAPQQRQIREVERKENCHLFDW